MIIIKGKYNGSFEDFEIHLSSNVTECERLIPYEKRKENYLSYTFEIDKSECKSVKWWVILLIIIACFIIIAISAIILVIKVKPIRSKVLPYRDRNLNRTESECNNSSNSRIYKSKTKVNPLSK